MAELSKKNQYFFEFMPIQLRWTPPRSKHKRKTPSKGAIKFFLYLDQTKIRESRQWIPIQFVQNLLKCPHSSLDFHILSKQGQIPTNCTIKVVISRDWQSSEVCIQGGEAGSQQELTQYMGGCLLDPSIYIDIFNEDKKAFFQENVEIADQISLDYQVYIDRTRFGLEKLIRQSKGDSGEGNLLASAFKKRIGHRKVRYVQISNSKQRSVKQEDFKRSHLHMISSLRKTGTKYVPQKMTNTHMMSTMAKSTNQEKGFPIKKKSSSELHLSEKQKSQLLLQEASLIKTKQKQPRMQQIQTTPSKFLLQNSKISQTPRYKDRYQVFERSLIVPHDTSRDHSIIQHRMSWDTILQRGFLTIFWLVSLILLYMAMIPTKRA